MFDTQNHTSVEVSSEKSFGIVFAVAFAIIGFLPQVGGQPLRIWALVVAVVFLLAAYIYPKILKYPNLVWFKFGMLLGMVIAPIVMAFVYFATIFPTGLFARLTGKDILCKRFDKDADTYWVKRDAPSGPMKNQY
jgi:hypothetical protein